MKQKNEPFIQEEDMTKKKKKKETLEEYRMKCREARLYYKYGILTDAKKVKTDSQIGSKYLDKMVFP